MPCDPFGKTTQDRRKRNAVGYAKQRLGNAGCATFETQLHQPLSNSLMHSHRRAYCKRISEYVSRLFGTL